ncbi:DUF2634 domain-containing protein [Thermosyntropha sp.]|uniref:DUF2634 domain-containing protein n=1 Tax=Thermosyntropha sp. TaxID=2740820 RepID=UPI0025EC0711|nr:DUF2634 domain-containing protein [Thermosyntropha sp.]MBO8158821.1 DUF2634 domain-containing protein [Thermosyntropha sp.]
MALFPDISVPNPNIVNTGSSTQITYGREPDFDFTTGEFILQDGKPKVVDGPDALRVWITKALLTTRYRWPIYSSAFGCELEDIIGFDLPRAVLESEIPRFVREALIYDDRIEDVKDFVVERGADWLKVTFTVVTFDGQTLRQGVTYNV